MGVSGKKLGRSLGIPDAKLGGGASVSSLSRVDRDGWRDAQPCVGSPTPGENTIMDGKLVQGSFGQSSGVVKLGTEVVELLRGWFLGRTGRVIPKDRDMDRYTRYGIWFTYT